MIDSHDTLVIHVDQRGLFEGGGREALILAKTFDGETRRLVVHPVA